MADHVGVIFLFSWTDSLQLGRDLDKIRPLACKWKHFFRFNIDFDVNIKIYTQLYSNNIKWISKYYPFYDLIRKYQG